MKIITCGPIVTYVITEHHIATIVYNYNDGKPSATIYIDGKLNGIFECENGQTMRLAMQDAVYQLKSNEHWEALDWTERQRWIARLNGMKGI